MKPERTPDISETTEQAEAISRRGFFKKAAVASGFVAALAACKGPTTSSSAAEDVFKDIKLVDQNGIPFVPADVLGGKPYIVVFGKGGCQVCEEMTVAVAALQKELQLRGRTNPALKELPIVVVDTRPETDNKPEARKEYVSSYYKGQVKQFADETLATSMDDREKQGVAAFDRAANTAQNKRIMHIVFPESSAQALKLQTTPEKFNVIASENSHTTQINFVGADGKIDRQVVGPAIIMGLLFTDKEKAAFPQTSATAFADKIEKHLENVKQLGPNK